VHTICSNNFPNICLVISFTDPPPAEISRYDLSDIKYDVISNSSNDTINFFVYQLIVFFFKGAITDPYIISCALLYTEKSKKKRKIIQFSINEFICILFIGIILILFVVKGTYSIVLKPLILLIILANIHFKNQQLN
jgi:hypothetical protein